MRQLARLPLSARASTYLEKKQDAVNGGADIEKTWARARATVTLRDVVGVLRQMCGVRERCMFCEDSHGTDIEHFWPKVRHPQRSFQWPNLLLACSGCNRKKGDRLVLDDHGHPLLIDPTRDDPWDHLFFDGQTGLLTAKYIQGRPSPRGAHTCSPDVLPLNIEAVSEGRLRVFRNLKRAVNAFFQQAADAPTEAQQEPTEAQQELVDAVMDNDRYGLGVWFFCRDGSTEPPFSKLRAKHPDVWQQIVARLTAA